MFDISILFLLQNITVVTLLFWVINWIGELLYKSKNHKNSREVFECGFFTSNTLQISVNLNFFFIAALFVLYDVEFLFLLPFLFNWSIITLNSLIFFMIFLMILFTSILFDWEFVALDWSI